MTVGVGQKMGEAPKSVCIRVQKPNKSGGQKDGREEQGDEASSSKRPAQDGRRVGSDGNRTYQEYEGGGYNQKAH